MLNDLFERTCARRDYKLKIDWKCIKCLPEDQSRNVKLTMCILDGEPAKDPDYIITETDLVHMECFKGHITRPFRTCSRCGLTYGFEMDVCKPCESRMRHIIECEDKIDEIKENIRVEKRTKSNYSKLSQELKTVEEQMSGLIGRT